MKKIALFVLSVVTFWGCSSSNTQNSYFTGMYTRFNGSEFIVDCATGSELFIDTLGGEYQKLKAEYKKLEADGKPIYCGFYGTLAPLLRGPDSVVMARKVTIDKFISFNPSLACNSVSSLSRGIMVSNNGDTLSLEKYYTFRMWDNGKKQYIEGTWCKTNGDAGVITPNNGTTPIKFTLMVGAQSSSNNLVLSFENSVDGQPVHFEPVS